MRNYYAVFDLATNRVGLAPHTTSFAADNEFDSTPIMEMLNITEEGYRWIGIIWCIIVIIVVLGLIDYYLLGGKDDEDDDGSGHSSSFLKRWRSKTHRKL